MKRQQGYVFRLTPNATQDTLLRQFIGCSRLVWNAILSENEFRYMEGDPLPIGRKSFCARLLDLKTKYAFLKDAHSQPLQQTLNDLVKAYERAFDPRLAAALPGVVGIDLGVNRWAALSDGTFIEGANAFKKHQSRLAVLQ